MMDKSRLAYQTLESCKYLFLQKLETAPDLTLTLFVVSGTVYEEKEPPPLTGDPAIDEMALNSKPIGPRPECDAFKIVFQKYILFSSLNESYYIPEEGQHFAKIFKYEESRFLKFVAAHSWASRDFPGPFFHYRIACEDHVIDVASQNDPIVHHWLLTAADVENLEPGASEHRLRT